MKLSAALFVFFAFTTPVTSIPLLDNANDDYINVRSVPVKRFNEQNIDKRQLSDAMFDIVIAIRVYADEYNYYHGYSKSDFTTNIVQELHNRNPHFNYIICHSGHDYDFGSSWGVDVYNVWVTYAFHYVGTDPGFDVVIGKNGTFTRYGDGGFVNWAYIGDVTSRTEVDYGTVVTFGIPD